MPGAPEGAASPGYQRYVLGNLMLVYLFCQMDRQIVSILQEPIKAELGISDSQLGLLTGFAFAFFYVTFGIPIARWADRSNRVKIIALALAVWSVMTALCAAAGSFVQLLLCRIGVGVGEAGCTPPAHSLIADYFDSSRRSSAMAIFSLGIPLGGALGVMLGGLLNAEFGWRTAFLAVGLPGVLLALIVRFTIREPRRAGAVAAKVEVLPFRACIAALMRSKTYVHIIAATSLFAFTGNGLAIWGPPFFMRTYGMETDVLGLALGGLNLVAGGLGALLGGFLGDRLSRRDGRWLVWLPALAIFISVPFTLIGLFQKTAWMALAFLVVPMGAMTVYSGPIYGLVQSLVEPRMRAVASATFLFIVGIIGMGGGPLAAGIISDLATGMFGREALRYALAIICVFSLWSVIHFCIAGNHVREELARAANGKGGSE